MNWKNTAAAVLGGVLIMAGAAGPARATLSGVDQLFVFGDSLSDTGNVKNAVGCPPGPCNPMTGRFSDGTNWIDDLGNAMGIQPTPFTPPVGAPAGSGAQGVNYAVGGAGSGSANGGLATLPGLQQQIGMHATATGGGALVGPNALFTLWIGANDYLLLAETNPLTVVANISNTISALYGLGARDFMVLNLPDIGQLPVVAGDPVAQAGLTALADGHNAALAAALPALFGTLPGANLVSVDVDALFDRILADPLAFGYDNITTPCLDIGESPPRPCGTPDTHLYWDIQHPTSKTHSLIGQLAANALVDAGIAVPAPATASLLLVGLVALARRRRG